MVINPNDILKCIQDTPCGFLKKGDICIAKSGIWTQGYGPEVTVWVAEGSYTDIQTMYIEDLATSRDRKINSLFQYEIEFDNQEHEKR